MSRWHPADRFAEARVASGRQEWLAYAREKWNEGQAASARGEYTTGTPRDIMARIRERVEKAL